MENEKLTNSMRVERARQRMTQQQLAEKTGVSRQTIHSVETGRFVPSTVLAIRIAQALKTTIDNLFKISKPC